VHKAHEVFSDVTGGRPPSFSRLISGGNPAESGKRGKTPPKISRRKDQVPILGSGNRRKGLMSLIRRLFCKLFNALRYK